MVEYHRKQTEKVLAKNCRKSIAHKVFNIMERPNLFSYATSELSQDAFICWLLEWSLPQYQKIDSKLHECAVNFIRTLFEKHAKQAPPIKNVNISKQDNNIDVLCIINGRYTILIEDKTDTMDHSDQLHRYLQDVMQRGYREKDILPIYFKTGDQGDCSEIRNKGYQPFLRSDFLKILKAYSGNDPIVADYRDYLQSISDMVEGYKSQPIEEWDWYSWIGFYLELQRRLGLSDCWNYVSNPKGGFLAFYWHFQGDEGCEQYLQLEEEKLCFKICVTHKNNQKSLRNKWYKKITAEGPNYGLKLTKPVRFGKGETMTVSIYNGKYRECSNGLIDIDKTVARLKKAEELLDAVKE